MLEKRTNINPITRMDYPDPDVIRVEDTYYMVSTTMHFFPGGALLKSYNLTDWEIVSYIFDELDCTPAQRMERESVDYSGGMWAPCLRFHNGRFYCIFGSHSDGGRTYLFSADDITGPWKKTVFEEYYHDCSLLFDDDNRVYLVYGNSDIHIQEFMPDLSGPKQNGLHKVIIQEKEDVIVGYEGSHIYKINGYYYVFLIHWPKGNMRIESCFRSKSLVDEFEGQDILNDDRNYHGQGVAQGGVVDTPSGRWYAMLFQDSGSVGRMPVLTNVEWVDGWPRLGTNGTVSDTLDIEVADKFRDYEYAPLYTSDNFEHMGVQTKKVGLQWQWNHQPDAACWHLDARGGLILRTNKLAINVTHAKNTLTQRMIYPGCSSEVTVTAKGIKDGDYAGICALQSCYGLLAITKSSGEYYLVKIVRTPDNLRHAPSVGDCLPGEVTDKIKLSSPTVTLGLKACFEDMKDEVSFYYIDNGRKTVIGEPHQMSFRLDHFTGYRVGLFIYSTRVVGGAAKFTEFKMEAVD